MNGIRIQAIDTIIVTSDASPGEFVIPRRIALYSGCSITAKTAAKTNTVMNGRKIKRVRTKDIVIEATRK